MDIIIDPYMLNLSNEIEIEASIPFFRQITGLCSSGVLRVCIYESFIKNLQTRQVQPFPIDIKLIRNRSLIDEILIINEAFNSAIMRQAIPLDIDECDGQQDFYVIKCKDTEKEVLLEDPYYDTISVLLSQCYNEELNLSGDIVIEKGIGVFNPGAEFAIRCRCESTTFKSVYRFSSLDDYYSDEDRAIQSLEEMANSGFLKYVSSPEIVRGEHHNKLQKDSNFNTFEKLSTKNKRTLSILRYFGLYKIVFGRYHPDTSEIKGNIVIEKCIENDTNSILNSWLFSEVGYRNHMDLYFPPKVGTLLMECLGKRVNPLNSGNLKEQLCL